jgi:hypothetical protein
MRANFLLYMRYLIVRYYNSIYSFAYSKVVSRDVCECYKTPTMIYNESRNLSRVTIVAVVPKSSHKYEYRFKMYTKVIKHLR